MLPGGGVDGGGEALLPCGPGTKEQQQQGSSGDHAPPPWMGAGGTEREEAPYLHTCRAVASRAMDAALLFFIPRFFLAASKPLDGAPCCLWLAPAAEVDEPLPSAL